ncbi:winged helix-turn-helix transcriptional regulator [Marinicella sp. W31]|uniref:winged helix-turn-helix transcriptional regulator n=1 Tax=Marinicella sp. W31 TaxID=3023713 RepID=UPI0037582AC6
MEQVLKLIGGKWKVIILHHLSDGTKRFNALRRLLPGITQRMLTRQLRELEADAIISRKVYAQVPPKVEYSLTEFGRSIQPVLDAIEQWGITYLDSVKAKKMN